VSSEHPKFSHRRNADGTLDSICTDCFVTIASEMSEADLVSKEGTHRCDPLLIAHYAFFKKEPHSEPIPEYESKLSGTIGRSMFRGG